MNDSLSKINGPQGCDVDSNAHISSDRSLQPLDSESVECIVSPVCTFPTRTSCPTPRQTEGHYGTTHTCSVRDVQIFGAHPRCVVLRHSMSYGSDQELPRRKPWIRSDQIVCNRAHTSVNPAAPFNSFVYSAFLTDKDHAVKPKSDRAR